MQPSSIPVVSFALARPFANALRSHHVAPEPILRAVGLEPSGLTDDDILIAAQNWYDFAEKAAQALQDRRLGFRIGSEAAIESLPNLRVLELPMATLGELLTTLVIDVQRFSTIATYELRTDGTKASLTTSRNFVPQTPPEQIDGYFAGFMVRILSLCSGNHWAPEDLEISVCAPEALPDDIRATCRLRKGDVQGAGFTFPALWLLQRTDGVLRQTQLTNAKASNAFLDALGAMLDLHLDRQGLSLEVFAALTGQSHHKLKRRLRDKGTSYQRELDKRRASRAMFLLQSTTLSAAEIGVQVGYPDPPSFGRAFRRWSGMTPAAYRKAKSI